MLAEPSSHGQAVRARHVQIQQHDTERAIGSLHRRRGRNAIGCLDRPHPPARQQIHQDAPVGPVVVDDQRREADELGRMRQYRGGNRNTADGQGHLDVKGAATTRLALDP